MPNYTPQACMSTYIFCLQETNVSPALCSLEPSNLPITTASLLWAYQLPVSYLFHCGNAILLDLFLLVVHKGKHLHLSSRQVPRGNSLPLRDQMPHIAIESAANQSDSTSNCIHCRDWVLEDQPRHQYCHRNLQKHVGSASGGGRERTAAQNTVVSYFKVAGNIESHCCS